MEESKKKSDYLIADPEQDLQAYLATYKDLTLDRDAHDGQIYETSPLLARDGIAEMLDDDPGQFSTEELHNIYLADTYLIHNASIAAAWFRDYPGRDTEPRAHWWWHLDLVADGVISPDPKKAYQGWKNAAGYTG